MNKLFFLKSAIVTTIGTLTNQSFSAEMVIEPAVRSYDYRYTSTASATSDPYNLTTTGLILNVDADFGFFRFGLPVTSKYKTKDQYISIDTSILADKFDSNFAAIFLPSYLQQSTEVDEKKFSNKSLSFWLGLFTFEQSKFTTINTKIKTDRFGLTSSKFFQNLQQLSDYTISNPNSEASKKIVARAKYLGVDPEECAGNFYFVFANFYCKKNNYWYYFNLQPGVDFYAIKSTSTQNNTSMSGTGLLYGLGVNASVAYSINNNHAVYFSVYGSRFHGNEKFKLHNQTINDRVTKSTNGIKLSYSLTW